MERKIFTSPKRPDWLLGPPIPQFSEYRRVMCRGKAAVREGDQSPASNGEVKNVWRYTSAAVACLYGVQSYLIFIY